VDGGRAHHSSSLSAATGVSTPNRSPIRARHLSFSALLLSHSASAEKASSIAIKLQDISFGISEKSEPPISLIATPDMRIYLSLAARSLCSLAAAIKVAPIAAVALLCVHNHLII
jgi:hypothetical protein